MKRKYIKQVETKILNYYDTKNKIFVLENIVSSLKEKIKDLKEKNEKLILDFDIDIKGVNIDGMPICIGNQNSYFENNIINQIEQNENMMEKIVEEICNKKLEIEKLKISNTIMDNIIDILSEQEKTIIKLRYNNKYTETTITEKLNLSVPTYHRNKNKIFENIYNLLLINGEI